VNTELRGVLDASRRACAPLSEPIVREWSHDGASCRVVLAELSPHQVPDAVARERTLALAAGYALEWKVYSHDHLPELADALVAAGFAAGDPETVLGIDLANAAWPRFTKPSVDVRAVRAEGGLADVAQISRAVGRRHVDEEMRALSAVLRERPDSLSIYVAYAGGDPVSCGRLHYGQDPAVAELAGGRTVPAQRNKGYFTAVVAARLHEAAERGCRYAFVDALPASESILRGLGLVAVTTTQPFTLQRSSARRARNDG
jgi:hypothetical protein